MNRATRPARGHRPEGSVGGRSAPEEEMGRRGPDGALAAKGLRPLRFRHVARRVVEVGAREIEHRRGIVRLEPAEAKVELSRRAKRHVARAQAPVEARHLDEVKPRSRRRFRPRPRRLPGPAGRPGQARRSDHAPTPRPVAVRGSVPPARAAGRARRSCRRRGGEWSRRRAGRFEEAASGVGRPETKGMGWSKCRGAVRAGRIRPPAAAPPAVWPRPPPVAPPPSRAGACGMPRPS